MIRSLVKYLGTLLALVAVGYGLLVLSYMLPTDRISRKVQQSYAVFKTEGTYRQLIPGVSSTTLDNFTDALMLLNAENKLEESAWKEALLVKRIGAPKHNPAQTLVAYHSKKDLKYTVGSYGRYWHGYLIYLKPLLTFFTYQHIRYLLVFIQTALVFATFYLLGVKKKNDVVFPLFAATFLLNLPVCAHSLQFTPVFVLTFAQFIFILLHSNLYERDSGRWPYHFFIIGCLTAYFDFLTYPLVTFGLPIAYLVSQYKGDVQTAMRQTVQSGVLWVTGYGFMWGAKWILGSLITQQDIIGQAIHAVKFRSSLSVNDATFSIIDVIGRNMAVGRWALWITLVIVLVCLFWAWKKKRLHSDIRMLPMAMIALLPFLWYTVASNHSWVHPWMAYRELAIFVYAVVTIGVMCNSRKSHFDDKE